MPSQPQLQPQLFWRGESVTAELPVPRGDHGVCSQLSAPVFASELAKQGADHQAAVPNPLPVLRLLTPVPI